MSDFNSFQKRPYIEDVEVFLRVHYNGRIVVLTQTNYNHLQRPLLVFFHFRLEVSNVWTEMLNVLSNEYPNIQFAIADLDDVALFHQNPHLMYTYKPSGFAIDADERRYKYQEPFTIDALTLYCDKLANNKLYRSDPIPTEQNPTDNVEIIVADNFRQLVEENEKNVFVTIDTSKSFPFPHRLWDLPSKLDKETTAFYKINSETNYVPVEYTVDKEPKTFAILRHDRSKKLLCSHKMLNLGSFISIEDAFKKIVQNQQRHEEAECIGNTTTEDQKKLRGILEKLTEIVEKKIPCEENDDRAFFKYLCAILNRVENAERVKMELITLASNRVNEVFKSKSSTVQQLGVK